MNCASYGFEVPSDFAFCPKCGTKLSTACPTCGFECPPDFAFCPKCGMPLGAEPTPWTATHPKTAPGTMQTPGARQGARAAAPGAAETDRRPVSVLFADLCGFTTLCERLDPEEIRTLQDDLFGEMSAAVDDYGGYIERFVGGQLTRKSSLLE